MRRERPTIILRKEGSRAVPISAFDEEQWQALPDRSEIDATPRSKRSNQQLRLYWSILSKIVAATDIAPSATHLHSLIKVELGYVTLVRLFDGTLQAWPDSAALDAMEPPDFNQFFEAAMSLLADRCGFDPMQALAEAA